MKTALCSLALIALAACSPRPPARTEAPAAPAAGAPAPAKFVVPAVPAGEYTADPSHTSVNFRVDHLGLSHFTARFTKVDAKLQFDPAHPAAASLSVTIDPRSVQTNYPEPKKLDFDAQVAREFFDAAHFPQITFKSTKVDLTGPNTAKVTGDLTLHGVTKPVVLETTFNGGYPANAMDPMGARIGFSAHTAFKRSDFGITYGVPAPGSTMGVGDQVDVAIETELTKPR
jgi:polyisoprenoid-binding protein YceI